MLRSKVYQEYAKWWQFWISKVPRNDTTSASRVKAAVLLRSRPLSMREPRLHFLQNPGKTITPLRCPTAPKGLYIDEES